MSFKEWKRKRRLDRAIDGSLAAERMSAITGLKIYNEDKNSRAHLRRNIHRLEKGLSIPTRRSVFAKDYIGETANLFANLCADPDWPENERKWASDVLSDYFAVTDHNVESIAAAHLIYNRHFEASIDPKGDRFAPYPFSEIDKLSPLADTGIGDFDQFRKLCRSRRSQRWFKDELPDRKVIEFAVEASLQSPSACNRQPFNFYITQNPALIVAITDIPLGTAGFGGQLPTVIAVVGNTASFGHFRDRHLIYIDSALASMSLMLGLTAAGYGSVPINWPDIPENHNKLRGLLGLEAHQIPVMLIGVGLPRADAKIPYSEKRTVHEILIDVDKKAN